MQSQREQRPLDPERRSIVAGAVAAPAVLLIGLVIGLIEGGLLPGACQGLACLFSTLVFGAASVIAVTWLVAWFVVRLAQRRWPTSTWRLWVLRVVAVVSWAPVAWLLILALDEL